MEQINICAARTACTLRLGRLCINLYKNTNDMTSQNSQPIDIADGSSSLHTENSLHKLKPANFREQIAVRSQSFKGA